MPELGCIIEGTHGSLSDCSFVPAVELGIQQHTRPADNGCVCEVERWPVPCGCVKIQKVGYCAVTKPIEHVTECAAQDEAASRRL